MDVALLKHKGLNPAANEPARLTGYGLRIGARASLVKSDTERVYGSVIQLDANEINSLYSENSVADYMPEQVVANSMHGDPLAAICYILPPDRLDGQNRAYAESLAKVARKIGLPADYIREIESWIK